MNFVEHRTADLGFRLSAFCFLLSRFQRDDETGQKLPELGRRVPGPVPESPRATRGSGTAIVPHGFHMEK
jgi:hypothetical protein